MTVLDLISGAMRLAGILAENEVPTANQSTNALSSLNDMLDSWSGENLFIPAVTEDDFTLVSGQQTYMMGNSGTPDFVSARPQEILKAVCRVNNGTSTFDLPMEIVNNDQWADIVVKQVQSPIPTRLYPEYTAPNVTISVWPEPNSTYGLTLWSKKILGDFTVLTTVLTLPPGYQKALRYGLAVELAPEYGRTLDNVTIKQAVMSKAQIKRLNTKKILASCDPAVTSRSSGFNWFTGNFE